MRKKAQPKIKTICEFCNDLFLSRPSTEKKYCSKKCYGLSRRGVKFSEDHKSKISQSLKGKRNYWCEKPKTAIMCPCGKTFYLTPSRLKPKHGKFCSRKCYYQYREPTGIAIGQKGNPDRSEKWKKKISIARIKNGSAKGKNNPNWQGGLTQLQHSIRGIYLYKEWRKKVYTRDNFTCVGCGQQGTGKNLNADHVIPLSLLIQKLKIKNLDDAILNNYIWDINNGRTLCIACHRKTDSYGWNATNNYLRKKQYYV